MKPIDEIVLSEQENYLLCEIEESEIARNDPRTKTPAFSALIGYDMLELIVSKKFPIEYDMYNNPIPNAYTVVNEVSRYWLYQAEKKSVSRKESRRYWVTTVIAIVALVLALFSLAWQIYTWSKESQEKAKEPGSESATVTVVEEDLPSSSITSGNDEQ